MSAKRSERVSFDEVCRASAYCERVEVKTRVQFYAQLRDMTQVAFDEIELLDGATVSDLLGKIYKKFPALRGHDKHILVGVGVEFVDRNYQPKSGEEISIMPPVQGG